MRKSILMIGKSKDAHELGHLMQSVKSNMPIRGETISKKDHNNKCCSSSSNGLNTDNSLKDKCLSSNCESNNEFDFLPKRMNSSPNVNKPVVQI